MTLIGEAAKRRDLGEAFVRIVRQQPLCAANATIRLPLSDGEPGRVPECIAKSLGRHLGDLRESLDRDGLPEIIADVPRDRVPIRAGGAAMSGRDALAGVFADRRNE